MHADLDPFRIRPRIFIRHARCLSSGQDVPLALRHLLCKSAVGVEIFYEVALIPHWRTAGGGASVRDPSGTYPVLCS